MIQFKAGDILNEDVEALVNTVNCVGVMGRGIALQFKNAFPENFKAYQAACHRDEMQPSRMFVFVTGYVTNPRYIINFPTKRHWRGKSRLSDIEAGLDALVAEIKSRDIKSVAIPPLGSGLGGLNWSEVKPRIEEAVRALTGVRVVIFEPNGAPDPKAMPRSRKVPTMTPGRASLVGLMHRYLGGLMDPFVSLIEVHKLMYFLQEAGEPLRLSYRKAAYGPYAVNLRHVLTKIEGHLISGYGDAGDTPEKLLQLVPGAVKDAAAFLKNHAATQARFDRVADLVEGFETPFGLELLSTVHWCSAEERKGSEDDVISQVYAWGERKKQFSPRQIRLALEVLTAKGWLLEGVETSQNGDHQYH